MWKLLLMASFLLTFWQKGGCVECRSICDSLWIISQRVFRIWTFISIFISNCSSLFAWCFWIFKDITWLPFLWEELLSFLHSRCLLLTNICYICHLLSSMCQDRGGLPLQFPQQYLSLFSLEKVYVSFWICVITWFKEALCAWKGVLHTSSSSWIKCFSLNVQQPSKGEETTQRDPMGWGMNSPTLSRTLVLIDFQPAKRQPFQKFSIKVTFVCFLVPSPMHAGSQIPDPTTQKRSHFPFLSNQTHLTKHYNVSNCFDLFISWLAQKNITGGVCSFCVCTEGAKGALYQVANMFPILWVPWLWTIVSAVCSLLSWSFSLLWVRARPSQYLFSTNTAPAQRHIVRSLFN